MSFIFLEKISFFFIFLSTRNPLIFKVVNVKKKKMYSWIVEFVCRSDVFIIILE